MTDQRIAKVIARAGYCSRRQAERWIIDGRVRIDGKVIDSPALNVVENACIEIDGKPISAKQATQLWLYHKPTGLITTHDDPQGRPTVFDHLSDDLPRVISVGRLDLNSEGLLLLTNDGELARRMELPETGIERSYRLRVKGRLSDKAITQLAAGLVVDGIHYGPIIVERESEKKEGQNHWVRATLAEGKNRELRRVFEHFGHSVSRLIRVTYGEYALGNLKVGEVYEVALPTASTSIRPSKLRSSFMRASGRPEGTEQAAAKAGGANHKRDERRVGDKK